MANTAFKTIDDNHPVFEDGDVIIRTGQTSSSIFVVHSAVLKSRAPFFAALFTGEWSTKETSVGLGSNQRPVWDLEMYLDRETGLGLLMAKDGNICTHAREAPVNLRYSPDVLRQWLAAKSDTEMQGLLGRTPPGKRPVTLNDIPRMQFWHHDQQPTQHAAIIHDFKVFPGSNKVHLFRALDISEDGTINTAYSPFFDTYLQIMPGFGPRPRTELGLAPRIPTHEETRKHLSAQWKMFLLLLYGRHVKKARGMKIWRAARLAANVMMLGQYYGALDMIAPGIEIFLFELPGIWQLVSEAPLCMMVFAYHIKSTAIYIDAAKHLIGRHTLVFQIRPSSPAAFRLDLDRYGLEQLPKDISTFLLEVCFNMHEAAAMRQQRLLTELEAVQLSIGEQERTNAVKLAQLVLINMIATGYARYGDKEGGASCLAIMNRDGSAGRLTAVWRIMWQCKESGDMTPLLTSFNHLSTTNLLGVGITELNLALRLILSSDRISAELDDYMLPRARLTRCRSCVKPATSLCIYSKRTWNMGWLRENLQPQALCPQHQHHAKYHDGRYPTMLHSWGTREHLGHSPAYSWPPPADRYYPNNPPQTVAEVTTRSASRPTLGAIGLEDVFTVALNQRDLATRSLR
ncbi:hypothetical protein OHC33_005880 [Knufia fluminis]|uniref:BTB domain-containing protein n=1 Tax=Knufia fluminis TaxID=191047 RepID=A0AAN8I3X7_9EURO|nr:hypothetical protein OHC33_005880 [Knufia fluminis]